MHRVSSFALRRRHLLIAGGAAATIGLTGFARPSRAQDPVPLRAVYPTRSGVSWPMFLAREAGLYEKHGLDVELEFGVGPVGIAGLVSGDIQMTNFSLDQFSLASVRDPILVAMASYANKGSFALVAREDIETVEDLRGRRMAVGRVGDPPYQYTIDLLGEYGLTADDVEWMPTGADASARAAMMIAGQVDAGLISPPAYFALEREGLNILTLMADHENVLLSLAYIFRKDWVADNPEVPEQIIRAQSEAVKLFYEDREAAMAAYQVYDPQASEEDVGRIYDDFVRTNTLERVPLLPRRGLEASIARVRGENADVETFDFQQVIDMSVVRRLIDEGFFEELFGPEIREEQDRKLQETFA